MSTLNTLLTPHFKLHTPHSTHNTTHTTHDTLHSTLHTLHSTLCTLHSTLYTLHFTLYTLHSTLYTLHSTLHTSHFTLRTAHCTPHALQFTHTTLHTPHSTPCTPPSSAFHSLQCTGTVTGAPCRLFNYNLFHKSVLRDCIRVRGLHLLFFADFNDAGAGENFVICRVNVGTCECGDMIIREQQLFLVWRSWHQGFDCGSCQQEFGFSKDRGELGWLDYRPHVFGGLTVYRLYQFRVSEWPSICLSTDDEFWAMTSKPNKTIQNKT